MIKIGGMPNDSVPVEQPTHDANTLRVNGPTKERNTATATTSGQVEDVVSLSPRTADAAAILRGVAMADNPQSDAEIQRLANAVADGSYRPKALKVAHSMLSFERMVAQKLRRE